MYRTILHTTLLIVSLLSAGLVQAQCISGNCLDGQGQYTFKNNTAIYTGNFLQSLPNGKGHCEFQNGDEYNGDWKNGKFHGEGMLTLADGSQLKGEWRQGSFEGASRKLQTNEVSYQSGQKIWALVVGVSDYHHMPVLRYADDDAYQFHNHLLASDGMALPSTQVKFLINESATRQNILSELQWIANQADEDDLILFYFSGHGLKGSFLPFDYDGFNHQVFHNEINNLLKPSKAANRICIADACHSGSLMAARGEEDTWIANWYPMLLSEQAEMTFFLSSKSSERSLESAGLRMGVFSHFLIEGLKGAAESNNDDLITLIELYQFVSARVSAYTGQQQHPLLAGEYDPNLVLRRQR